MSVCVLGMGGGGLIEKIVRHINTLPPLFNNTESLQEILQLMISTLKVKSLTYFKDVCTQQRFVLSISCLKLTDQ